MRGWVIIGDDLMFYDFFIYLLISGILLLINLFDLKRVKNRFKFSFALSEFDTSVVYFCRKMMNSGNKISNND